MARRAISRRRGCPPWRGIPRDGCNDGWTVGREPGATAGSDQIDAVVLSGGGSRVDGLREMLEERFGTAVEAFDPFRAVTWDAARLGAPEDAAPSAAVAIGLALRKAGDR